MEPSGSIQAAEQAFEEQTVEPANIVEKRASSESNVQTKLRSGSNSSWTTDISTGSVSSRDSAFTDPGDSNSESRTDESSSKETPGIKRMIDESGRVLFK